MHTRGRHILAEFHGCNATVLNSVTLIEKAMRAAAAAAGASVVQSSFHKFGPEGVSGVLVLAESHLSVHTWPEHNYAASDIFTCGDTCLPERAHPVLHKALDAQTVEIMVVDRGRSGPRGMRLVSHETEETPAIRPLSAAERGEQYTQSRQCKDGPSSGPE